MQLESAKPPASTDCCCCSLKQHEGSFGITQFGGGGGGGSFPIYPMVRKGLFHMCDYPLCDYSEIAACMERNSKSTLQNIPILVTQLHERPYALLKTLPVTAFCIFSDSFHICNFYVSFCFQGLAVSVCKASLSLVMGQSQGC